MIRCKINKSLQRLTTSWATLVIRVFELMSFEITSNIAVLSVVDARERSHFVARTLNTGPIGPRRSVFVRYVVVYTIWFFLKSFCISFLFKKYFWNFFFYLKNLIKKRYWLKFFLKKLKHCINQHNKIIKCPQKLQVENKTVKEL